MADISFDDLIPQSTAHSGAQLSFDDLIPKSVKSQLEEGRKLEADRQYENESGVTHFARSVLSGATLGHEPELMAELHDSPLSSPAEVAMSERQRIERFKREHPYASAAGNALGGLAGLASGGMLADAPAAVAGAGNVLGRLGSAAAPYVAPMAGRIAENVAGPVNFLRNLTGH